MTGGSIFTFRLLPLYVVPSCWHAVSLLWGPLTSIMPASLSPYNGQAQALRKSTSSCSLCKTEQNRERRRKKSLPFTTAMDHESAIRKPTNGTLWLRPHPLPLLPLVLRHQATLSSLRYGSPDNPVGINDDVFNWPCVRQELVLKDEDSTAEMRLRKSQTMTASPYHEFYTTTSK